MPTANALSGSILTLPDRSRAAKPALEAVLLAETAKVLAKARANWPVDTEKSKAGLKLEVLRRSTFIEVRIRNDVPYVPHIRPRKLGGGKYAWIEYVEKPLEAALPEIRRKMAQALVAALARGANG